MATSDRFNILIVDPDTGSRGKLKQVAMSLTTFNKITVANTLGEALDKGKFGEQIDVIVISYRFAMKEISDFIKSVKATPKGEEWAFVTVLKSSDQQNEIIADSVINGVDGFLFEPYSADNLREMAEITAKVKKQNSDKRKLAAMKMLLVEIAKHVDALSFYKSQGKDLQSAQKKLTDACEKLKKYREEFYEIYLEAMIDIFSNIKPPANKSYTGVSSRVKQNLEAKRFAQLQAEYE